MKRKLRLVIVGCCLFFVTACSVHTHVVGAGPSSGLTVSARQYYALWGLIPLNKVDSNSMAGETNNYAIETKQRGVDVLISIAANIIIPTTISSRTVMVTK